MPFLAEMRRRKVIQVAAVYAVVAWLLVQIVSTVEEPLGLPGWFDTGIIVLLAVGFPVALILSWAFDLTPDRVIREQTSETAPASSGRTIEYVLIGLLGIVVAWVVARDIITSTGSPVVQEATVSNDPATTAERDVIPNSIAVLVCDNLSPDPDNAYIAQSLHEEMLNQLFKLRDLRVISRTSVLPYMGAGRPPLLEIAEALKVQTIMECSVAYGDDRVAISAQLIDPDTGVHIWSERYYRDLSDIFQVQADIAMNIANALAIEFSTEEQQQVARAQTSNNDAFLYYLRAIAEEQQGNLAHALLDQALRLDPRFARAYATKAYWYTFDLVGAGGAGPDEAAQFESLVRSNAETALSIDANLAIARAALAVADYVYWRGSAAEESFQQAMELNPNDPAVLVMYGRFKRYRGEYDESARLLQQALELDPSNPLFRGQLGLTYRASGAWEEAVELYRALVNEGPRLNTIVNYANVLALLGQGNEALRQLQIAEELDPNTFRISQIARTYGILGRSDDAARMLRILEERDASDPVSHGNWARAYIAVRDYDAALVRIRLAVENRVPTDLANLAEFANNTWKDPELDKPAFRAVLNGLWDDR